MRSSDPGLEAFKGQRVVLLQGPMGPFFSRLARELRGHGARVTKVNFNAGDALFYRGEDVVSFRGTREEWPSAFRAILGEARPAAVILFGDSRPLHVAAIEIARDYGVSVLVFEEGYLRPDCITIEQGGVNQNSSMPRDIGAYPTELDAPELVPIGSTYRYMASFACCYSLALTFFGWRYPGYRHHKRLNAFYEAFAGVRSFFRWLRYSFTERAIMKRIERRWIGKFFLVALQVHDDFQIKNSRFEDVADFIREVVRSFAQHAPKDQRLVFKHHPLDRGYRDYGPLLRALAQTHGLGGRLVYVHDLHLPTLLRCARGCVVLNSTVGMSALFHGTPLKVLDNAVYDIPGLTAQIPLDEFWSSDAEVDALAYHRVRSFMLRENQGNGSFYRRHPMAGPSGVLWPPNLRVAAPVRAAAMAERAVPDREAKGSRRLSMSDVVPSSQRQLGS